MKALIFGVSGQVATELARTIPAGVQADFLGRAQADLMDPAACAAAIVVRDLDVVINAAAYTVVDKAEGDEAQAHVVNADAPGAMAQAAAAQGIPFVHVSTDYVFDGTGSTPWQPADTTAPLGAYGRSKLAGEQAVAQAGGTYAIVRTSWVFSAHGNNFLKTMLRLSHTHSQLRIVADQIGGPTPAGAIAQMLWQVAQSRCTDPGGGGLYHFAGAPEVSWAGFAREIFAAAGRDVAVEDIPSAAYPTPAPRPLNSRMDCSALERAFGIGQPDWRAAVREIVAELGEGS